MNLIKTGIMPRKITSKEGRDIVNEINATGIKDTDLRFRLAIMKAIDKTNTRPVIKSQKKKT